MGVNIGQWLVGTGTVSTLAIPAGPYSMVVYNTGVNTLWMMTGTSATVAPNLSTASGLVMHSVPTTWMGYQSSRQAFLWALNTAATAVPFNYILSTSEM